MMTPDEVMVMDEDAALIFTRGHPTIRATRIRHFNQPLFSRRTKIPPPAQSDRILRVSDKQQEQAPGPPGAEIRQLPHSPEKPQHRRKWERRGRAAARAAGAVSKDENYSCQRKGNRRRSDPVKEGSEVIMRRLHHVACYLSPDEYSHLKEQAAKRRLSLSTYVKGCLLGHHETQPLKKDPSQWRRVRCFAPVGRKREADRRAGRRKGR